MNQDTEVQLQPLRTILSKMKHAAAQRSSQAIQLSDSLKKSEHPVILCGDFNDSPSSFTYCKLSAGLNDAFLEAGWGISPTYAAFPLLFRIDYILADSTFRFQKFKTIREPLTDHYPVVATFTARP
jgi:endonuclease/exonuclease/phosphatase family metal-dependent hydrolase